MTFPRHLDAYLHITPAQLAAVMPRCPDPVAWARAFDDAVECFGRVDVPMLLAQAGHESADLTRLEESLWYSEDRLIAVWPSRFRTFAEAQPFARNPEALANNVYGGRMGNTEPGDGWRFRGRGPLQLTGRDNYQRFANSINSREPVDHPERLIEPELGALSAVWYFVTRVTHGADIRQVTREVNGGYNGLKDRERRYHAALNLIGGQANRGHDAR